MRTIIADCSVNYSGRGETTLPEAKRLILIKSDGAISIHSDEGNKPLNYMGKGSILTIANLGNDNMLWTFSNKKEKIEVLITKVYFDKKIKLTSEPGLTRLKTESQLQEFLSKKPYLVGEGFALYAREYRTPVGSIDMVLKDGDHFVVVELKRKAMIDAVYQVKRYMDYLNETGELGSRPVPMIVALDIRPNTLKLAEKHNIKCLEVTNF
jgi:endonuclease